MSDLTAKALYGAIPLPSFVEKGRLLLSISLILLFAMPFNAEFGTLASGNLSQAGGGGATAQNLSDAINITLGAFNSSSQAGNTPLLTDSLPLAENSTGGSQQSENNTPPQEKTATEREAEASSQEAFSTTAPLTVLLNDSEAETTSPPDVLTITGAGNEIGTSPAEESNATEGQNATELLNETSAQPLNLTEALNTSLNFTEELNLSENTILNLTAGINLTENQTVDLTNLSSSDNNSSNFVNLTNPTNSIIAELQSAVIVEGAPVEWTATIENITSENITIELPADAEITDATRTAPAPTQGQSAPEQTEPTVQAQPTEQQTWPANESIPQEQPATEQTVPATNPVEQQAAAPAQEQPAAPLPIPDEQMAINQTNETQFLSIENATGTIELNFTTPAPTKNETNLTETSKEIVVSSETHYENIMASTTLPSEVASTDSIHLYWTIYNTTGHLDSLSLSQSELDELSAQGQITKEAPFLASDTNNNSLYDTIEWLVPSLSNQTYLLSLSVLTVYSHPVLGGNWSVDFTTTGTANLSIAATNDSNYSSFTTRWSDSSEDASLYDLHALSLTCGAALPGQGGNASGGTPVSYNWSGTSCDSQDCPLTIENYSCDNETSTLTSKVLTAKPHVLKFNFGGEEKYAYNNVSQSICANLSTAGENYTLTGDATAAGYTCFNITAANVTLDCNGSSITGNSTTGTYGIYTNQLGTTVRNCRISGFDFGIYTYRGLGTLVLGTTTGNMHNAINMR